MTRSLQNIFDTVAEHLLIQSEKSILGGSCAYRGEDGRRCAIGVFIPDEYYDESMEGITLGCIPDNVDELAGDEVRFCQALRNNGIDVYNDKTIELLRMLQRVHDAHLIKNWPEKLYWVAERYGLDASVVEQPD